MLNPEVLVVSPSNALPRPSADSFYPVFHPLREADEQHTTTWGRFGGGRWAEVGDAVIQRVREVMEIAWLRLYSAFLTNVSNNLVCLGGLQRVFCPALGLATTGDQIN